MDAPGTRYKVVERGRRLEVVDTWDGNATVNPVRPEPAQQAPRRDASAARESLRRETPLPIEAVRAPKLDQRGRGLLHTKAWYDSKGPRQIVVTQQGEEKLKGLRIVALVGLAIGAVLAFFFWPLLFVAPFILWNGETRKSLRTASTRFLDTLNQPTGSSTG